MKRIFATNALFLIFTSFVFILGGCKGSEEPNGSTSTSSKSSQSSSFQVQKTPIETPSSPVLASSDLVSTGEVALLDQTTNASGQFSVSESGAAIYSFPIHAPLSTAGVAPQISIIYNSQMSGGRVGKGGVISGGSAISRCRQTLLQDHAALPITWSQSDRFCLNGERLLLQNGEYGAPGSSYKTEIDRYITVTAKGGVLGHPDYFESTAKDGSLTIYGGAGDNDSEVASYDGGTKRTDRILTWSISRFEDSLGNPITYHYISTPATHFLDQIRYGYGAHSSAGVSMSFKYSETVNPISAYIAGSRFNNSGRLDAIEVLNELSQHVLRKYDFVYEGDLLSAIKTCEQSVCLPETRIHYDSVDVKYDGQESVLLSIPQFLGHKILDINGDGVQDLIWLAGDGVGQKVSYRLGTLSSGLGSEHFLTYVNAAPTNETNLAKLEIVDYNVDGRQDVFVYNPGATAARRWQLYLSSPSGDGSWSLQASSVYLPVSRPDIRFSDVNGDGLVDFYYFSRVDVIKVHHLQKSEQSLSSATHYAYQTTERANLMIVPWFDTPGVNENAQVGQFEIDGFGDFNGDGQTDVILNFVYYNPCSCPGDASAPSTGAKVAFVRDGSLLNFYHRFQLGTYVTKIVDINQDGLSDVVFSGFNRRNWFYHISTGKAFEGRVEIIKDLMDTDPKLLDVNADGNIDFVWAHSNELRYNSWDPQNNILSLDTYDVLLSADSSIATEDNSNNTSAYDFVDFSGDGVLDLMYLDKQKGELKVKWGRTRFDLNKPTRFVDGLGNVTEVNYRPLNYSNYYTSVESVNIGSSTRTQCYTQYRGAGDPGTEVCSNVEVFGIDSDDFYTQINDPFAEYAGKTLSGTETAPLLELVGSIPVVTRVTTSAPTVKNPRNIRGSAYFYHQARFQAGGRGMLGFKKVSQVDLHTGLTTTTQYRQDWPFLGYPEKVTVTTGEGHKLSESISSATLIGFEDLSASEWAEQRTLAQQKGTQALGPLKVYTHYVEQMTYDLVENGAQQGPLLSQVNTQTLQDAYGNVTSSVITYFEDDEPVGLTTTTNDYGTNSWDLQFGRLKSSQVEMARFGDDAAGTTNSTRSVEFGYYGRDGDCAIAGLDQHEGMLCREAQTTSTALALTTYHFYDAFGNKTFTQSSGEQGETRLSAYSQYDERGRFVDQVYDIFRTGLTATTTTPSDYYNSQARGAIVKVSDVNSRDEYGTPTQSSTYLDGNNRSAKVIQTQATSAFGKPYFKANSTGSYEIALASKASNTHCPSNTVYHTIRRSAGASKSYKCFDSLSREIRMATPGFKAGQWVYADTEYNYLGQVERSSQPYLAGSTVYWNRFEYDLLGRQTRAYRTVNGVEELSTTEHQGLTTTFTNPKQQSRNETRNTFGDVVTITNSEGSAHYKYNATGDLAQLTDPAQNLTTIQYDKLGNKIGMDDPSKGAWTYRYNSFGQIVCQQDAKRQAVVNQYDMNGRLLKRMDHAAGGSCDDVKTLGAVVSHTEWEYDTAQYGLGQLNAVSDLTSGYRESVRYDTLGRVNLSNTYLPSGPERGSHYQKTTYDHFGRVHMSYDAARNGEQFDHNGILHQYNERGFLTQLKDGFSGARYFEVQNMDAYGHATETVLGNGVQQTDRYYQDTGLAEYFRSHTAAGDLLRLNMNWDEVGNLENREVIHQLGREFEDFGYDHLNRLSDYDVEGRDAVDVTYNHLGNIISKSDVQNGATYQYNTNGAGPYAVSQIGSIQYHYDANGNLERDDRKRNFRYTTFDKVQRIEQDNRRVLYTYGPNRNRYQRIDQDTQTGRENTTYYLGSVEKIHYASGKVQWKRSIGGVVQITQTLNSAKQVASEETVYFHKDHLGSINLITDQKGLYQASMAFGPWGARRNIAWQNLTRNQVLTSWWMNENTTTLRGFTGHEMADGVDVINMNGRIYDAHLGRFVQADPIIQAPTLIGSLNRYSYVMNNPLNGIDPSGYSALSNLWKEVRPFIGAIVGAALMLWAPWAASAWAPMVTGMIAGGVQAAANGGNVLMGMAFGAFTGSVAMGGAGWESTLMGGLVGGGASMMMGGKFGYGFVAASVGTMIGGNIGNPAGRIIASAALGGTITEMTGGKFKNGAASAAFAAMIGELGRYGKVRHSSSHHDKEYNTIDKRAPTGRKSFSNEQLVDIDGRLSLARERLVGQTLGTNADGAALTLTADQELMNLSDEYRIEVGADLTQQGKVLSIKTSYHHSEVDGVTVSRGSGISIWHTHPGNPNQTSFGIVEDGRSLSGADAEIANTNGARVYAAYRDGSLLYVSPKMSAAPGSMTADRQYQYLYNKNSQSWRPHGYIR